VELGLAGRRAVVTGGSKGIGKAIAGELMGEGAAVTICSRHPGELGATAAELMKQAASETAGTVLAMPCDVTDPGQVTEFVDAASAAMGGIDILVNNAGAARPGQFATLTDDDWHTDIETKLFSQIRCTGPHCRTCGRAVRRGSSTSTPFMGVIPTRSSSRRRSTGLPASASPRLFPWSWAVRESW